LWERGRVGMCTGLQTQAAVCGGVRCMYRVGTGVSDCTLRLNSLMTTK
jgi:hypothetical protein